MADELLFRVEGYLSHRHTKADAWKLHLPWSDFPDDSAQRKAFREDHKALEIQEKTYTITAATDEGLCQCLRELFPSLVLRITRVWSVLLPNKDNVSIHVRHDSNSTDEAWSARFLKSCLLELGADERMLKQPTDDEGAITIFAKSDIELCWNLFLLCPPIADMSFVRVWELAGYAPSTAGLFDDLDNDDEW